MLTAHGRAINISTSILSLNLAIWYFWIRSLKLLFDSIFICSFFLNYPNNQFEIKILNAFFYVFTKLLFQRKSTHLSNFSWRKNIKCCRSYNLYKYAKKKFLNASYLECERNIIHFLLTVSLNIALIWVYRKDSANAFSLSKGPRKIKKIRWGVSIKNFLIKSLTFYKYRAYKAIGKRHVCF